MKKMNSIKKPAQQNVHQKEMDKIANDMAVLFEKKITASELAEWIALINQHEDNPEEVREFIFIFGFSFLPRFIKCNTKIQKIDFLREETISAFSCIGKALLFESVGLIGVKFSTGFQTLRSDAECVEEFMKTYTTFLCLCEMYEEYEFYRGELEKEIKKAA